MAEKEIEVEAGWLKKEEVEGGKEIQVERKVEFSEEEEFEVVSAFMDMVRDSMRAKKRRIEEAAS